MPATCSELRRGACWVGLVGGGDVTRGRTAGRRGGTPCRGLLITHDSVEIFVSAGMYLMMFNCGGWGRWLMEKGMGSRVPLIVLPV